MRVWRCEVIEEELTTREKIIGNLEQLHQISSRKLFDAFFSAWIVADSWRGVDASQERMNAA